MGNSMPNMKDCGPPPFVPNANVSTKLFGIANYTCHEGYDMQGDPTSMLCVFGSWVGDLPHCTLPDVLASNSGDDYDNSKIYSLCCIIIY